MRASRRRPTIVAAAAPNRINIGGAGTSVPDELDVVLPPDDDELVDVELELDVELDEDVDELVEVDELVDDDELVLVETLPDVEDRLPEVELVDETLPDVLDILPELVVVLETLPELVEVETLPELVDVVDVETLPEVELVEVTPPVVVVVELTAPFDVVPPDVVEEITTLPPPPPPPPKKPPKKPPPKPPIEPPPITTGALPPPPEYGTGGAGGIYGGGSGTIAICGCSQHVRLMILRTRLTVRGFSLRAIRFTLFTGWAVLAIFSFRYSVVGDWVSATWTAPPPMTAQPAAQADNLARAIRTDISDALFVSA